MVETMATYLCAVVWTCLLVQAYHFAGYPALLAVMSKIRPRPHRRAECKARVSLIISAYNEEKVIAKKIENSLALDQNDLEIIVNSEGSTDRTAEIVAGFTNRGITAMHMPERRGKSAALNDAVTRATSEILVFSDANVFYDAGAIAALTPNFADPEVGIVTGRKTVRPTQDATGNAAEEEGLYWKYENGIKFLESSLGSTIAVHGEMLAIRRHLFEAIPAGVVNDDAYLALRVLGAGYRVIFERNALCWEAPSQSLADDAKRRRRISSGRFQLIKDWRLWPTRSFLTLFMFASHKVLRLFLPLFAVIALLGNLWAVALPDVSTSMLFTLAVQLGVGALAIAGSMGGAASRAFPPCRIAAYIVSSYIANLAALWLTIRGQQSVLWERVAR